MRNVVLVTEEEMAELKRLVPPYPVAVDAGTMHTFDGVELVVLPPGTAPPSDAVRTRFLEWMKAYKPFHPMSWKELTRPGWCPP